jgi:hypothetical protein
LTIIIFRVYKEGNKTGDGIRGWNDGRRETGDDVSADEEEDEVTVAPEVL